MRVPGPWHSPSSKKSAFMMTESLLGNFKVQSRTWAPILWHDSCNNVKQKYSWKYSRTLAGNQDPVQDQCSNNWAKSQLSDAVVRDWLYTRCYAKSTSCIYIGESAWPVTTITSTAWIIDLLSTSAWTFSFSYLLSPFLLFSSITRVMCCNPRVWVK